MKHLNAFSGFSVNNLEDARKFYRDILGLQVEENEMGLLELRLTADNKVIIYPKDNHTAATFTILNFTVENIDKTVDDLSSLGVQFEHYNDPHFKTDEKGICRGVPQVAWFKDPAGNILAVIEES